MHQCLQSACEMYSVNFFYAFPTDPPPRYASLPATQHHVCARARFNERASDKAWVTWRALRQLSAHPAALMTPVCWLLACRRGRVGPSRGGGGATSRVAMRTRCPPRFPAAVSACRGYGSACCDARRIGVTGAVRTIARGHGPCACTLVCVDVDVVVCDWRGTRSRERWRGSSRERAPRGWTCARRSLVGEKGGNARRAGCAPASDVCNKRRAHMRA